MEQKHEKGKTMTTAEVVQWLEEFGLGEYKELFEDEGVNGSLLAELDMDMLEEMGVSKKYHRKKLITNLKNFRTLKFNISMMLISSILVRTSL